MGSHAGPVRVSPRLRTGAGWLWPSWLTQGSGPGAQAVSGSPGHDGGGLGAASGTDVKARLSLAAGLWPPLSPGQPGPAHDQVVLVGGQGPVAGRPHRRAVTSERPGGGLGDRRGPQPPQTHRGLQLLRRLCQLVRPPTEKAALLAHASCPPRHQLPPDTPRPLSPKHRAQPPPPGCEDAQQHTPHPGALRGRVPPPALGATSPRLVAQGVTTPPWAPGRDDTSGWLLPPVAVRGSGRSCHQARPKASVLGFSSHRGGTGRLSLGTACVRGCHGGGWLDAAPGGAPASLSARI